MINDLFLSLSLFFFYKKSKYTYKSIRNLNLVESTYSLGLQLKDKTKLHKL